MPAGASNGRSNRAGVAKNTPNTLLVTLKLSTSALQQFVEDTADTKSITTTAQPQDFPDKTERSSPASSSEVPAARPSSADADSNADAISTPATGATPGDTPRRKGIPGPKPGNKRVNGVIDPAARVRGRPGPKKKPRLEDGTDPSKLNAAHRLGPKANTGAINAGLRALDRTGAPCRKWERQPFKLRSFTGVMWQLPAWGSYKLAQAEADEAKEVVLESGDSDTKVLTVPGPDTVNGSSAVPSEKSNSGDGDVTPAPFNLVEPSSPAVASTA
ncbi:hypothetical protein N7462_000204 [Penicillium macrosclerotiorum]|uniref:uncharacterized protein n=1 Tax=Penicillium macrosclerotiorum TaxID=303699 RepID=UPI0025474D29|nr:uncharacterized protein N7462_000204 [Penicillium macrosclerotiorum]KAJ5698199.1 hypothetical protein N7462_000204 [Penicillium macrosclerotiorum]